MFISEAFAQSAGGASGGFGNLSSIAIFIPIILIMYFLIIRPQRQQMKKRQEMLNSVHRGDTVVTGGGIVGKVTKVYDESGELEVEISDSVKIRVLRSTLADVRRIETAAPKAAPAANTKKTNPKAKKQADVSKTENVAETSETKTTTKAKK